MQLNSLAVAYFSIFPLAPAVYPAFVSDDNTDLCGDLEPAVGEQISNDALVLRGAMRNWLGMRVPETEEIDPATRIIELLIYEALCGGRMQPEPPWPGGVRARWQAEMRDDPYLTSIATLK